MQCPPVRPHNARRLQGRLWALLLPCGATLLGCTADQVHLGGRGVVREAPASERLSAGCVVDHDVTVDDQADLDDLAGCTEVRGKLRIHSFPDMDLTPLAALQRVRDVLEIGATDSEIEVPSLQGLESLERVGNLTISHLAGDLTPLRNLWSVRMVPNDSDRGFGYSGAIELHGCNGLTDLRGLEHLGDWQRLLIDGLDHLESLDGLVPPPDAGALMGMHLPELKDLSALGAARILDSISLSWTGIETFRGVDLDILHSLVLEHNPALTDLGALGSLVSLGELVLDSNALLRRLPDMPHLEHLEGLQILNNPALESIPAYPASFPYTFSIGPSSQRSPNQPENPPGGFDFFVVGNNRALRSIAAPAGFTHGDYFAVYDNPSLTDLDVRGIADVDLFSLRNNLALARLNASSLQIAKRLEVLGNPLLPLSMFDEVQAGARELSDTLPEPSDPTLP